MSIKVLALVSLLFIAVVSTQEDRDDMAQNKKWKLIHQNYEKQMRLIEQTPIKLSKQEQGVLQAQTKYKNKMFEQIMQKSRPSQNIKSPRFQSFLSKLNRPIPEVDSAETFFDKDGFTKSIHSLPPLGNVTRTPWSGSYWPMRNGGISMRFNKNDKNTIGILDPETKEFVSFFNWAQSVSRYAQPEDHNTWSKTPDFAKFVDDNYSPAEKYDLLIGDYNYTLTNYAKNEGAAHQWGGDVVGWFGSCHGWGVASSYYPRPSHSVVLTAVNGMAITFQPDDIKGLTTQFWANAEYKTKFAGQRCDYYYPDPGWFTSSGCASLNPGAFLTILGNQCGLMGKNLIIDPNADPEIWNQPIWGYEFRYYNPLTGDFFPNAASAKVSMDAMRGASDSFNQHVANISAPKALSAVGVFMRVTYAKMTDITELKHDGTTAKDESQTDDFDSIVTLDANDNVIGGEWKFKLHPNFAWWFDENEPVKSVADEDVPVYNTQLFADKLSEIVNASNKGQILKGVSDVLASSSA
jgi:hypothetical protein